MRKDDKHGRWTLVFTEKQYRNDLGQVPGYDKFAEDKEGSEGEMFSLRLVHFFLLPEMMRRFILTLEILFVSLFFWEEVFRKWRNCPEYIRRRNDLHFTACRRD